ncbi:MAG: hypothetical protein K6T65_01400 [Peptococcaceae bacterium]|nr:hypothetical protein [Peptococcaceae bacterium]
MENDILVENLKKVFQTQADALVKKIQETETLAEHNFAEEILALCELTNTILRVKGICA